MPEYLPLLISVVVALIGGLGGIAALVRVNADKVNIVAEASTKVVNMLSAQLDEHSQRLDALEKYTEEIDTWADRLIYAVERAIEAIPSPAADPFRLEVEQLKKARPKRKNILEKTP